MLEELKNNIEQKLIGSGELEISGVLDALEGKFISPGPSGAPSRGRPDVLPTVETFIRLIPEQFLLQQPGN